MIWFDSIQFDFVMISVYIHVQFWIILSNRFPNNCNVQADLNNQSFPFLKIAFSLQYCTIVFNAICTAILFHFLLNSVYVWIRLRILGQSTLWNENIVSFLRKKNGPTKYNTQQMSFRNHMKYVHRLKLARTPQLPAIYSQIHLSCAACRDL